MNDITGEARAVVERNGVADAVLFILSRPRHVQVQDILLSPMGQGL